MKQLDLTTWYATVNCSEAMLELYCDCQLCPIAAIGNLVLSNFELLFYLRKPGFAIFRLHISEHTCLRVSKSVSAGDELAEAVGAEVVGDTGCFV